MASHYLEFSEILVVDKADLEKAEAACKSAIAEIEADAGYCGCEASAVDDRAHTGIWIRSGDSGDVDHAAYIAKAVVEALGIDEPFLLSWAFHCSKLRVGEFGGGAFAVRRGHKTKFIDATALAQAAISEPWQPEDT